MPIAAIPQGIELRKISATQQKAVDELLKKQKEATLWNSAIPSTTALLIAAGAGGIFLFRDEIKQWFKDQAGNIGEAVKDKIIDTAKGTGGVVADIITDVIGRENPRTPEFITLGDGRTVGPLSRCKRWETDYIDSVVATQNASEFEKTALAVAQLNIIKNMKAEKCDRPPRISQSKWDEA